VVQKEEKTMITILVFSMVFLLCLMISDVFAEDANYPKPKPAQDTASYGKHFQRSITLMATSTPEKRNTIRILYYGQSITGQRWSDMVDAYLKEKFPNTDFVIKNLAIGGFGSQFLVRTMYYDLLPFYPDLLIFHVYGSHIEYENIIKEVRKQTTAEIIIQTDHATNWPEPKANSVEEQKAWDGKMNNWYLPEIAKKYNCALQPQRDEWVQYMKDNNLEPKALLSDTVHLNEHGKLLMAELMKRFMVYLPDEPQDEWKDTVRTFVVGKDLDWYDNRLTLEFEGNRVVALAAEGPVGTAQVLVDGKKPEEFPECYTFTRPSGTKNIGWPAIMKFTWQNPPVLEEWTATFSDFNTEHNDFKFTITGSVTGFDGSGTGKEKFISNSGRIIIEPQDWIFAFDRRVSNQPTPDGWTVKWKVVPMFVNAYTTPEVKDPSHEYPTVIIQGLENTKHKLELVAAGGQKPSIKAIRVYTPPR
jgi:hypothetical protein